MIAVSALAALTRDVNLFAAIRAALAEHVESAAPLAGSVVEIRLTFHRPPSLDLPIVDSSPAAIALKHLGSLGSQFDRCPPARVFGFFVRRKYLQFLEAGDGRVFTGLFRHVLHR
ncbi:Uncharacterised protein [Mycobacteroides abscessus subsp. massiliense]|uniref:Uncharacterized protein n=1 Tax=Mycobacteroides abscessus subsp. massiliense TaxID=1962118 RepID=A0A1T8TSA4_9MYCO|nr:Uncharacterised protein [Mycobacteroides abscessus subsp. massiliense]SKT61773.1 Uncharacterised protein [Mycobacteroides abscessus subsp. massiliense]SKX38910.1 Uncharacterised protein [Mycobacteroides abscessus subsp. massiliense]